MYDTPGKCLPRLYEQALAGQQTATGFAASCPQYRTDINRDFAFEIMNKGDRDNEKKSISSDFRSSDDSSRTDRLRRRYWKFPKQQ